MLDIVITTPRLLIRPPTLDDLYKIQEAKIEAWTELQKWMSWSSNDQKGPKKLREHIKAIGTDKDNLFLCAFHKITQDFVVASGIHKSGKNEGVYSTGYWSNPKYEGQGLATEATNAIIRYGFGAFGVNEMTISHYGGNEVSKRIIEKLGFTFVRTQENGHRSFHDDNLLDEHHYTMKSPDKLPTLEVIWG